MSLVGTCFCPAGVRPQPLESNPSPGNCPCRWRNSALPTSSPGLRVAGPGSIGGAAQLVTVKRARMNNAAVEIPGRMVWPPTTRRLRWASVSSEAPRARQRLAHLNNSTTQRQRPGSEMSEPGRCSFAHPEPDPHGSDQAFRAERLRIVCVTLDEVEAVAADDLGVDVTILGEQEV